MSYKLFLFTTLLFCFSSFLFGQNHKTDQWLQEGNANFENLNYSEAIESYQKSWDKTQNIEALWGLANATFELGNQLNLNGQSQKAQTRYSNAFELANQLTNLDSHEVDYLLFRGKMYLYNGKADRATLDFEEAKSKFPDSGRVYYYLWTQVNIDLASKVKHDYIEKAFSLDPNLFELHQELGTYYTNLNNADEAIFHYEKALEISPKNYKANFALGQVYWALGDLDKMRVHFQQSLDYFPDFGYAKMYLAGVELMSSNTPAAIPLIKTALKDNPATEQLLTFYIQNYPELANYNFQGTKEESPVDALGYPTYYSQGVALAQAFDFYSAIDVLHQSNDIYGDYALAQPAWQASILSWLTHCYREIGNYGAAAQTGKQALELSIKNNLTTDQASLASNLSMVYYTWGDYPKTIAYARASIGYLEKNNQRGQLYDAYINIGSYYRKWEQADSAVYFHKKALDEIQSPTEMKYVVAQKELALSYVALGKMNAAKTIILQMNKTRETYDFSDQNSVLDLGSAEVYYALGDYKIAWEYISKAFDHFSQVEQVSPDHPTLIPFLEKYVGLSVKLNKKELAAKNYQALNQKLINQISTYFSAMSENGKLLFYRDVKKHFESFNSYAVYETKLDQNILTQLLKNQLLLKGVLFNDQMKIQKAMLASEDKSLKSTYQVLMDNKNLLARSVSLSPEEKNNRRLDAKQIQHDIDSLQIQLLNMGMEPSTNSVFEPELVHKVKQVLAPGEAAIEMVRFRTFDFSKGGKFTEQVNYLALILKEGSDKISYVHIKNGNELEGKNYQAYSNAISFELEDHKSYEAFWKPITDQLSDVGRVYLSGDGIYHKINVNTLLNPASGQFVIDELDVHLVTSSRDLLKPNSPLPIRGDILLVGFPTYQLGTGVTTPDKNKKTIATRAFTNIENLAPLPGTYTEVTTIESILDQTKWKTKVLTGEDALEEKIKELNNTTILHIATHGYFQETSPKDNPLFYSGLFLSGASSKFQNKSEDGDDGILTAYEAMHLNLNETQMVVLSACETGMGHIENGEGVYGLQRAFLIAGSKSVVMSFWKVNDQTTMDLMINFYKNLSTNKDKHVAFKNAQLQLKMKHPNPKYWGAFNIVGR
ncbi:MAG: CHAT domain-containing protein [Reichenbachiella sp.]|uniref:CHAT domain-containing protein n=3 Tax=Reichenbachiella sp. TaxID=2184521 RepID=UPI00329A04F5